MAFSWFRKKDDGNNVITIKCDAHETMVKRLSRIEGENLVIMAILVVIMAAILGRVV
jgi:hypothetical protein